MIIRLEKNKMHNPTISVEEYMKAEIKTVTGLDNELEEYEILPLGSDDLYQDFYIKANEKEPLDCVYMLPAGERIEFNGKQEPLSKVTELEEPIPYKNIDVSTPKTTTFIRSEQGWVLQASEHIEVAGEYEPTNMIFRTKNNTLVSLIDGKISFTEIPDLYVFVKASAYIEVVSTLYELSKNELIYKPLLQESIMLAEKLYGSSVIGNKPSKPLSKEILDVLQKAYKESQQAQHNSMQTDVDIEQFLKKHPKLLRSVLAKLTTDEQPKPKNTNEFNQKLRDLNAKKDM